MLVVVLAMLGACSALRFGYNQADDLAYWWLDGYLDFNENQSPQVRKALAQWHEWHRRTQLPDYAALLAKAASEANAPTSPQRLCSWWGEVRSRIDVSLERAIPSAAEIMLTLTPQQVQHIERRYAKSNEEFRDDYLQAEPARRQKESVKRAVERAESFYGRLDDAQRERITRTVGLSPFDADLWFKERKLRQQDALQMLRRLKAESAGIDPAQAALRAYAERASRSPRPEFARYAETLVQYNCAATAEIHNTTNATQRQALIAKLKGWELDLRSLTGNATP